WIWTALPAARASSIKPLEARIRGLIGGDAYQADEAAVGLHVSHLAKGDLLPTSKPRATHRTLPISFPQLDIRYAASTHAAVSAALDAAPIDVLVNNAVLAA